MLAALNLVNASYTSIAPKFSAASSLRFGSEPSGNPLLPSQVPLPSTDWGKVAKEVGKEILASPLPLWRRPFAFLRPSNWVAGFKAAKETFMASKHKSLEGLALALDVTLSFMSMKVLFVLNALFPKFALSETAKAFFNGVHQASADRLNPPQDKTEPCPQEIKSATA